MYKQSDDLITNDSDNTFISTVFASNIQTVLVGSPFGSLDDVDLVRKNLISVNKLFTKLLTIYKTKRRYFSRCTQNQKITST